MRAVFIYLPLLLELRSAAISTAEFTPTRTEPQPASTTAAAPVGVPWFTSTEVLEITTYYFPTTFPTKFVTRALTDWAGPLPYPYGLAETEGHDFSATIISYYARSLQACAAAFTASTDLVNCLCKIYTSCAPDPDRAFETTAYWAWMGLRCPLAYYGDYWKANYKYYNGVLPTGYSNGQAFSTPFQTCSRWGSCTMDLPSCAHNCALSVIFNNVGHAAGCFLGEWRGALNPCACKHFQRCRTDCSGNELEASSFSTWSQVICANALPASNVDTDYTSNFADPYTFRHERDHEKRLPECMKNCSRSILKTRDVEWISTCNYPANSFGPRSSITITYISRSGTPASIDACNCQLISQCAKEPSCTSGEDRISILVAMLYSCPSAVSTSYGVKFQYQTTPPFSFSVSYKDVATTGPSDAVGYLSSLASNSAPACVNQISTQCPELLSAAKICYNQYITTTRQACFCTAVANTSCSDICGVEQGARDYLSLVLNTCHAITIDSANFSSEADKTSNISTKDFVTNWRDYEPFRKQAYLNLFPWSWRLQYDPEDDHRKPESKEAPECPSNLSKLGAFAIINLVTFVITIFCGRRTFVYKISCGKLGKPGGSSIWILSAIFFTFLTILANVVNAIIIKNSPGFSSVNVGGLVLLWLSRPRIAWVGALLVMIEKEREIYFTTGASALVSELILQILGSVYLSRTVNYARKTNSLIGSKSWEDIVQSGRPAHLMYSGAVVWLAAVIAALLQFIWTFLGVGKLVRKCLGSSKAKIQDAPRRAGEELEDAVAYRIRARFAPMVPRFVAGVQGYIENPDEFHNRPSRIDDGQRAPAEAAAIEDAIRREEAIERRNRIMDVRWRTALHKMGLSEASLKSMTLVVMWMILPFIGQWMFWVGFVRLASDL